MRGMIICIVYDFYYIFIGVRVQGTDEYSTVIKERGTTLQGCLLLCEGRRNQYIFHFFRMVEAKKDFHGGFGFGAFRSY